jgi:hypothetical protein
MKVEKSETEHEKKDKNLLKKSLCEPKSSCMFAARFDRG